MATSVSDLAKRIQERFTETLPEVRSVGAPRRVTAWRNSRYFEVEASVSGCDLTFFMRQSETNEAQAHEARVYTDILPSLSVQTPRLYGVFELDPGSPRWMIFDSIQGEAADLSDAKVREKLIAQLGSLHSEGRAVVASGSAFPRFDGRSGRYAKWGTILTQGLEKGGYGLPIWIVEFLDCVLKELDDTPFTLLHGDLDPSNILVTPEGRIVFIDWEKASLGSPSIDLGHLVEAVESASEWEAYSAGNLSIDPARAAKVGRSYHMLNDVVGYVHTSERGRPPSDEWRRKYYDPCLRKLAETKLWLGW